ncbi:MAG: hypothetical protein Q7S95_00990 [bacterium]|nr:hypothetical protein [bacterium]
MAVKVEHFREDHERIIRITCSTSERGSHCAAQLLVPDGRGSYQAFRLSSTISVPISGETIAGVTKLAEIARLCPLHVEWGRRERPLLEELHGRLGRARTTLDLVLRAPEGQGPDEAMARTALTELHQRITDYLAEPRAGNR